MHVLRCLGDSPLCPSQRAGDYPLGEERGRGRLPCGVVRLLGMHVGVVQEQPVSVGTHHRDDKGTSSLSLSLSYNRTFTLLNAEGI